MRAESRADRLRTALGFPRPEILTQDSYDADEETIRRIRDGRPAVRDWDGYIEAAIYGKPFQPDLFGYVLPEILTRWEETIGENHFGELVPLALVRCLPVAIPLEQMLPVAEYLAESVLDRFERLEWLAPPDRAASNVVYQWVEMLGTAALVPGSIRHLMAAWSRLETVGPATAMMQFASCVFYRTTENPLFPAWTPQLGGGPPCLWEEPGFAFGRGWHPSNTVGLADSLSPERLIELATLASDLVHPVDRGLARHIVSEIPVRRSFIEDRWPLLLKMLEEPQSSLSELWDA